MYDVDNKHVSISLFNFFIYLIRGHDTLVYGSLDFRCGRAEAQYDAQIR